MELDLIQREDSEATDKLQVLIEEYSGDDEMLRKISDRIHYLMYNNFSNVSKDLARLGHILKTDYHVDNMLKIHLDKDSSYVAWYACKTIANIGTEYALQKALELRIADSHIMPLYLKYQNRQEVINWIIEIIDTEIYVGAGKVRPEHIYKNYITANIKTAKVQQYLIAKFKRCLAEKPYKARECGPILKVLAPYRNQPEIAELFETLSSQTKELQNLARIYQLDVDRGKLNHQVLSKKIALAVDRKQFEIIAYLFKWMYDPINKRFAFASLASYVKLLEPHIDVMIESSEKKRLNDPRDKRDVCYGLNPLGGFSDFTFQDYYDELICLSMIGQFTENKVVYDKIQHYFTTFLTKDNQGMFFQGDKYTRKACMSSLKKNTQFAGEKTEMNDILKRFYLHSNSKISDDDINLEIECLLALADSASGDTEKYYRLLISNYLNPEYRWMINIYQRDHKQEMLESEKKLSLLISGNSGSARIFVGPESVLCTDFGN